MSLNKTINRLKSDAALLRAYAKGDASAFESLYSRYKDQMFNHLCHQLGTRSDKLTAAEEIAQEVWMAVIRGAENFEEQASDEGSSFPAWLFSIAHRRLADFWRKHYKHTDSENTLSEAPDLEPHSNEDEQEQSRLVQELHRGLSELPAEQRQCFLLREEGFSYQEIADITETGSEAVKSRLRYAKISLQQLLEDTEARND